MSRSHTPNSWTWWISLALAALLGVLVWEAVSDEPPSSSHTSRVPVAVIDLGTVFKEHRGFAERMAGIKSEIEDFHRDVRARHVEIDRIKNDDRDRAIRMLDELNDEIESKEKIVLDKEAAVYLEVYPEIQRHAEVICRQRDIGLLLRYNDRMNKGDRTSILRCVTQPVVHSRALDVTAEVIQLVNAARQ